MFSLKDKTAVLTGASGYLGHYFANGLAQFEASLVLIDIDEKKLSYLSNELKSKYDVKCLSYVCDITQPLQVTDTLKTVSKDFNNLDILINNAQANDDQLSFEKTKIENWRKTSSVNEEGVFLMSQAVGNYMIEMGNSGSIVQISSIYGVLGPDHRIYKDSKNNGSSMGSPAVYSYTKAGIIGLTRYLAAYWAKDNIRVNVLTPGGVIGNQNDNFKSRYNNRVPMNRMAKPEELVGALIYLCSDASSYVTGQNMIIDGGLSAW